MKIKNILLPLVLVSLLFSNFFVVVNKAIGQSDQISAPDKLPDQFLGCAPGDKLTACIGKIAVQILRFLMLLAIIFAAIFLVWSGIEYILKGADAEKRKHALDRIIYSVIGLIVALISFAMINIIRNWIEKGNASF